MSYNSNSINVNTNGVSSTPLTITTPDTTNPLTIKNSSSVEVCSISNSGVITCAGKEVLTTNYNPIFCGGFVNNNGTKATTIGRVDYTVTSSATGKYLITYSSSYGSNNYMPTITCWNSSGSFALLGVAGALTNQTRLEVHTFSSNALANSFFFYFMVY